MRLMSSSVRSWLETEADVEGVSRMKAVFGSLYCWRFDLDGRLKVINGAEVLTAGLDEVVCPRAQARSSG